MVPASCTWFVRMTPWSRYGSYDTFLDSTFHPHTVGDASVGGPRSFSAGSGPDDSASSLYLQNLAEPLEHASRYWSYTGSLVVRLR